MALGEDPGGPLDGGLAFEPRPVGGRQAAAGRRAWAVVAGALTLVVAAVFGGLVDDRTPRADDAFVDPTDGGPRSSDRRPRFATAMPQLVVQDPTRPPTGRVLTFTDGYRWLDLASGSFGDLVPMSVPFERLPDGTFLCACIDSPWSPGDQVMTLHVERFEADGSRLGESRSIEFSGVREGGPSSNVVSVGRTFSDDGATVFAGAAARTATGAWRFEIVALPVETGAAERLMLGEIGGEPAIRYVSPPTVSLSHDGRYAVVAAAIQRGSFRNPEPLERAHWLVRLERGTPRAAEPFGLPPAAGGEDRCVAEGFVDNRVYADVCSTFDRATGAIVPTVRRFGVDGRLLSEAELAPRPMISANVLLDRATRSIFAWDPDGHVLYRIDGRDGSLTSGGVPAGVLASAGAGNPPDRHFLLNSTQSFVLSPDRSRVYAIGAAGGSIDRAPGSTGIWTFDAGTLDWIDRWAPATNYAALGISDDGGRLFAAGLSGVTADGLPSAAEASVTVHDADDGEVVVVAGRLGWNFTIRFPTT